jgi:hypothetical protein
MCEHALIALINAVYPGSSSLTFGRLGKPHQLS